MKIVRLGLLAAAFILIPLLVAGCDAAWSVAAKAWLDTDGNGRPDAGEKPLPGIPVHGVIASISRTVTVTTNANGMAKLYIFPTDQNPEGEVYVDAPPQYMLTTRGRYTAPNTPENQPILFGFTYAAGFIPTPRPPAAVTCTRWEIGRGHADLPEVKDIFLAPDGSAWVIANWPAGGYVHVRPDDPPGLLALTPVAPKYPRHIAVTATGDVWLTSEKGLVQIRDGSQRVHLGAPFPEEPNSLFDVAALADGTVLVSGWYGGLALFDPMRASWTTHPLSTTNMTELRKAPDGAIWGVGTEESSKAFIVALAPPSGQATAGSVRKIVEISLWSRESEVAPDGAWWFSGVPSDKAERDGDGLVRVDPATGQLTRYDRQAAQSPLGDEWIPSFAIAPDGSVFIGTTHNGLLHLQPETKEWQAYTAADGLPGDTIGLVAAESADTVWLAACNPAGPECDFDDGNYRPLGWINVLARCTIGAAQR